MNFIDLQYFIAAAEEMSFTKAADKMHITQQSMSGRIAKLEEHLDVRLFDREPNLMLTEAGTYFYQKALSLCSLHRQTIDGLEDIKDFRRGSLTIGILREQGIHVLPRVLPEFHKKYPQIRLHLVEDSADTVKKLLYNGQISLAFGYSLDIDETKVKSIPLFASDFVVVVPHSIFCDCFSEEEQSRMLKAEKLSLDTFRRCPFLALNGVTWLKEAFETCCRSYNLEPDIVIETKNFMTRLALCFSGMGIMFSSASFFDTNKSFLNERQLKNIHIFHIDYPETHQMVSVHYLKNRALSKGSQEFIRMLKEIYL